MLEQIKQYLNDKYNLEIDKYNKLKEEMEKLEKQVLDMNPIEKYNNDLKLLNKKYSTIKRNSEEYKKEKSEIDDEYHNELLNFKQIHDKYTDLRKEISKIDIYGIQRKMNRLEKSKELKDLNLTEETAQQVLMGEKDI